jgi:hypothetical protein
MVTKYRVVKPPYGLDEMWFKRFFKGKPRSLTNWVEAEGDLHFDDRYILLKHKSESFSWWFEKSAVEVMEVKPRVRRNKLQNEESVEGSR